MKKLVLVLALFSISGDSQSSSDHVDEVVTTVSWSESSIYEYERCDESDADYFIVVELRIPTLRCDDVTRIPVRRNFNANAPGFKNSALVCRACGESAYFGSCISLTDHDGIENGVSLGVSADWNDTTVAGGQGEAEGKIVVPWLGEASKDLGNGASVRVYFDSPKQ